MTPAEALAYIASCRDSHVACWTADDPDAPPSALGSRAWHDEVAADYQRVLDALTPLVRGEPS